LKVNPTRSKKIVRAGSKNEQRSPATAPMPEPAKHSRPTIIDVAKMAKVSPATVSNALNERPNVDQETRKRVLAAVEKLGYTPNLRARRLRTGRADTIAIFSSMSMAIAGGRARLGFTMEIAAAAAVRALESGIALVLVPPSTSGRPAFGDLHIDGALIVEPMKGDLEFALLQHRGVPIVSIGQYPGKEVVPYVDLNPYQVAKLLTEHLYRQKAHNIALIVGAQQRHTHLETERAYRDFASAHRMRAIVRRADEAGGEQAGYAAAVDLLSKHTELDGLFVSVDAFAAGTRRAAAELGRTVPGDLKMATRYDGIHARESDPPLTAVNLHLDELAVLGVEMLLEHIAGRTERKFAIGPMATLIQRASSA
jgi:DNA-binding LacI/PurR family transcriptional regulator